MKYEEEIAFEFLNGLGYKEVVYEPNGNNPPDFSLDSEIGVEVRRLSQLHFYNDNSRSLEEAEIPLIQAIKSCLEEFDEDAISDSYAIVLKFKRPLDRTGIIKNNLRNVLATFLSGNLSGHRSRREDLQNDCGIPLS